MMANICGKAKLILAGNSGLSYLITTVLNYFFKFQVKSQITFGHETMAASEWVFLTKNASTVRAHIGSTALLPCEVKKDSQFGMVSKRKGQTKSK